VSEYRQADLKYPLQHAAECMLTTAPPAEAGDLLEATAQLTTMGRWAEWVLLRKLVTASGSKQHTRSYGAAETHTQIASCLRTAEKTAADTTCICALRFTAGSCYSCDAGTMSLQRPSTRERQQGRIAMTVLEPAAGLMGSSAAAAGAYNDSQEQQQQQQQQPFEPSTSRSGVGSDTWQQQQGTGRSQTDWEQQQEQLQSVAAAANTVSLKVRVGAGSCGATQLVCH
jgi:hypothetical protein